MRRDHIARILSHTMPSMDMEWKGDANETVIFARQLEYFFAKIYDKEYPDGQGRSIVPINTSVPSGAESHTYRMFDEVGQAEILHTYAQDVPMVDETGTETAQKIIGLGVGFFISIQDLRRAAMAGYALDARKAMTAKRVMEQKLDELLAIGSTAVNMTGFANDPNVSAAAVSGLTGTWSTATAAQIQADLEKIAKIPFDTTLGIHGDPNNGTGVTIVLPPSLYSILASKRIDTFNMLTVLEYAKLHLPFVKEIKSWARLETAGAGSVPRIVVFDRNADVVEGVLPQDFEILPMQPKGLGYLTMTHMRFGGVVVRYPKAMRYVDGA